MRSGGGGESSGKAGGRLCGRWSRIPRQGLGQGTACCDVGDSQAHLCPQPSRAPTSLGVEAHVLPAVHKALTSSHVGLIAAPVTRQVWPCPALGLLRAHCALPPERPPPWSALPPERHRAPFHLLCSGPPVQPLPLPQARRHSPPPLLLCLVPSTKSSIPRHFLACLVCGWAALLGLGSQCGTPVWLVPCDCPAGPCGRAGAEQTGARETLLKELVRRGGPWARDPEPMG